MADDAFGKLILNLKTMGILVYIVFTKLEIRVLLDDFDEIHDPQNSIECNLKGFRIIFIGSQWIQDRLYWIVNCFGIACIGLDLVQNCIYWTVPGITIANGP